MDSEFKLAKFSSFSIRDPEMVSKYASLGYFHYQYIKLLDPMNSYENIVKDNGVMRGARWNLHDGSYIAVAIVDFKTKRKTMCLYRYERHRLHLTVSDLTNLVDEIARSLKTDALDCFVKFDVYTLLGD